MNAMDFKLDQFVEGPSCKSVTLFEVTCRLKKNFNET